MGPFTPDRIKRLWTLNSCFNKKQSDWWIHLSAPQHPPPLHSKLTRLALDARLQNWIKFSAKFSHGRSVAHPDVYLNYVLYVQYTATSFRITLINLQYDLFCPKKTLSYTAHIPSSDCTRTFAWFFFRKLRIWNRNFEDPPIIEIRALKLILYEILWNVKAILAYFVCVCVHLLNKIYKKS